MLLDIYSLLTIVTVFASFVGLILGISKNVAFLIFKVVLSSILLILSVVVAITVPTTSLLLAVFSIVLWTIITALWASSLREQLLANPQ